MGWLWAPGCSAQAPPITSSHKQAAQPIQDRRLQQEGLDVLRLALQHLFQEIVEDEAVASGKRLDKGRNVRHISPLYRHRRHLQAGDPPLGAIRQRGDVARGQLEAGDLGQKLSGLVCGEAQIVLAQLVDLATAAQPGYQAVADRPGWR